MAPSSKRKSPKSSHYQTLKAEALAAYSSTPVPSCACCGAHAYLEIDHLAGGGEAHRMRLGVGGKRGGGHDVLQDLKRQGWPPGYGLLCRGCNANKWNGARCSHADDLEHIWPRKMQEVERDGDFLFFV